MRDWKVRQKEAQEEEKRKKAIKERKAREAMAAMRSKANSKALAKSNYTFDFDGDLIIIRKPIPETLPNECVGPKVVH